MKDRMLEMDSVTGISATWRLLHRTAVEEDERPITDGSAGCGKRWKIV